MKNINKILALLLTWLISIGNVAAEWFPEEPMVIYGNVTWSNIENKTLNIFDLENTLLEQVQIFNSKYGTNKTFDISNKISLSPYTWTLKFQIDGYDFTWVSKWETMSCETETTFQKWNICEYNLSFKEKVVVAPIVSSWGGWGGWGGWSSSSSSSTNTTTKISTIKTEITNENKENIKIGEQVNINVKRNEDWKIVIKWTDYIKNLKMFNANKKEEKNILWKKVLTVKWDDAYNKNVENNVKQIHKDIQLDSIRKSMIKHLDKMTISYWIYTDSNLSEELRETYKEKLREDKEYFELKFKKLIRKDEIIRYTLEKRKAWN